MCMREKNSHDEKQCHNYVSPACCVATVCHQVRCVYWGHLGHFHRAISHLKWYRIVCMRYLACTFSQMKFINIFSMFCNLEFPGISFGDLLWFEYITSLFSCLCMSMLTSNSGGNMQKHGYLGCFHATVRRGKYILALDNSRTSNRHFTIVYIWRFPLRQYFR